MANLDKNSKISKSLTDNNNAEKWTLEEATKLFNDAYELSQQDRFDFIGEVAKELRTYRQIFIYLSDKFPSLKPIYSKIINNLEANCFLHSKNGDIVAAVGIVNLKANHKWVDRVQTENKTEVKIDFADLTEEELEAKLNELRSKTN